LSKRDKHPAMRKAPAPSSPDLFVDVRQMIEEARSTVAAAVNAGLTLLYWRVGRRVGQEILKGERAEYGAEIVSALGKQLTADYGRGFAEKNLRRMVRFAEVFPEDRIVVTLSRQLSWSHFLALVPLDQSLQRDFYAEMCRVERWSVRTLRKKIDSMLYERTAISRKPQEVACPAFRSAARCHAGRAVCA
jgi:hypothetical protein